MSGVRIMKNKTINYELGWGGEHNMSFKNTSKKLFLRVRITISCRMNFDDYPLDAHTCQFQVGSCKSLTQKGQHAKLFSLQITTQKTWWLARPSSSTTWSGSAVYSISSQSKTCRSSFTPSSFPQVIHVTTMAKCISIKTHTLNYVSWSVPHEIFTACRKKYIDGAKW